MTRPSTKSPDSGQPAKPDKAKRAITLYLDARIISRLEELSATTEDPKLQQRSASWLVNSIMSEKLGIFEEDGDSHE